MVLVLTDLCIEVDLLKLLLETLSITDLSLLIEEVITLALTETDLEVLLISSLTEISLETDLS